MGEGSTIFDEEATGVGLLLDRSLAFPLPSEVWRGIGGSFETGILGLARTIFLATRDCEIGERDSKKKIGVRKIESS